MGEGWLIFGLPPAEVAAAHPAEGDECWLDELAKGRPMEKILRE